MLAQPKTHPCKTSPMISAKDRDLEHLLRLASIYRKTAGASARTDGDDSQMLGRVLLADDHPAVRKTLRALLTENSVRICGEAENGRQAIDKATELQPDVVVLDLVMPETNGLEAAYEIRQRAPASKIILLSLHYSPQDGLAFANALGADAFVDKSALASDLIPAIGRVLSAKLKQPKRLERPRFVVVPTNIGNQFG
jgi:CheY-like chemotaxis protein